MGTYSDIISLANKDNSVMIQATAAITASNTTATAKITAKNDTLIEKQQIQESQMKEIENKARLLLTRSRMLQISQDRNSYKTKIIYTLLAILIVIFIINLFIWSLKKSSVNVK